MNIANFVSSEINSCCLFHICVYQHKFICCCLRREFDARFYCRRLIRLQGYRLAPFKQFLFALGEEVNRDVLQRLQSPVDDQNLKLNVVFMYVHEGLGVDRVRVTSQLHQLGQFRHEIGFVPDRLQLHFIDLLV